MSFVQLSEDERLELLKEARAALIAALPEGQQFSLTLFGFDDEKRAVHHRSVHTFQNCHAPTLLRTVADHLEMACIRNN